MPSFDEFDKGEFILYGDKKQPLEVTDVREDRLLVAGPQGGEYVLFYGDDGETLLEATPGKRQYASVIENLRHVGRWEQQDDGRYVHSASGDTIEVVQEDTGFWTIETTLDDVDLPKYGWTDREDADEKARSLVTDRTDPSGD